MFQFFRKLWASLFPEDDPFAELGIPKRLYTNGRLPDSTFEDREDIYRRFNIEGNPQDWEKDNRVSASVIPVSDDSVNRSKYSGFPEDVLYNTRPQDKGTHYLDYGILAFNVEAFKQLPIKPIINNGVRREFSFHLEHRPVDCMYPHTEIWILENGKKVNPEAPKSVRAGVRKSLLSITKIIKQRGTRVDL